MPLIIVAALVVMAGSTLVIKAVSADADGCSSGGIQLNITADPSIAAAVAEVGASFTASRPDVNGRCIRVDVTAQASSEVANGLGTYAGHAIDVAAQPAPTPAEADLPMVWIPDSSYWLERVRAVDQELFGADAPSVASSRVVLAVPEAVARTFAAELASGLDAASIKELLKGGKLTIGTIDPRRDTAGMVGAMLLSEAVVTSEADLPTLVGAYRKVVGPMADVDALWASFAKNVHAAPVSEQAVLVHNGTGTPAAVAAVALSGVPTLDFPYLVRSRQARALTEAAAKFYAALTAPEHRASFASRGLRGPDGAAAPGFPTGHGITAAAAHVEPFKDLAKVRNALRIWIAAKTPSRVIALVDATSSMSKAMGGGHSAVRLDVLRGAAVGGLKLFTNDSQVGLWAYAGRGHQELVPLGELTKAQRAKLEGAVAQARPSATDDCPLYQTIIEGYRTLLDGYDPKLRNTLVIFTDGKDTSGLAIRKVQRELERLTDVTKPIRVVLLGLGPDIHLPDLQAIADTTGGVAFQVSDPSQMQAIFLSALLA